MEKREAILTEKAKASIKHAYAGYSNYRVGAAVEDEQGRIFTGCNIENASYGATVCAERTAVFKAVSEGAKKIVGIAIAAEGSIPYPCGICRQVLAEFMDKNGIVLLVRGDRMEKYIFGELMPHTFEM